MGLLLRIWRSPDSAYAGSYDCAKKVVSESRTG